MFFLPFVKFIPTLLFLLIMLISLLIGYLRGFSKSMKLFINMLVCAVITTILYFIFSNAGNFDSNIVKIANIFLKDGGLQSLLGVPNAEPTLTSIVEEKIISSVSYGDGISLILKDNGMYLATIVQVICNLVVAVVCYVIYLILLLFAYIGYHIFYPERRRKRRILASVAKRNDNHEETKNADLNEIFDDNNEKKEKDKKKKKEPIGYRPMRLAGLGIGAIRGLLFSFVLFGFLGAFLFLATGGVETKEDLKADYDFGSEELNNYRDIYKYIDQYDNWGLYKILNSMHTSDNLPFYLFASNIVASAKLEDPSNDINQNVYLMKEGASYVAFARNTYSLLYKYGGEELFTSLIQSDDSFSLKLKEVFSNSEFNSEFNELIDDYNTNNNFIFNFAFAFINSFVMHIDEINIEGLNPDVKEILKIMFVPGYLSKDIPSEKALLDEKNDSTDPKYVLASIKPQQLLKKEDANTIFNLIFYSFSIDETTNSFEVLDSILTYIKKLTIFSSSRALELNPIYQRLYNYLDAKVLSTEFKNENDVLANDIIKYASTDSSINWVEELQALIDVAISSVKILKNVDVTKEDFIFDILDSTKPYYDENKACFDVLKDSISSSKLLDKVLNTVKIRTMIQQAFTSFSPNMIIPENISWTGENGEIKQFLPLLESFLSNKIIKENITKLQSASDEEKLPLVKGILDAIGEEKITSLADSVLFSSLLTGAINDLDSGDFKIIVPEYLIIDGVIEKEELKTLLKALITLIPSSMDTNSILINTLDNVSLVMKSTIIKTTISNYFVDKIVPTISEFLIVDDKLKEDGTINNLKSKEDNLWILEVDYLLTGFSNLFDTNDFDISDEEKLKNTVSNSLLNITSDKIESIYRSRILSLSITSILDKAYESFVDENIRNGLKVNDAYPYSEVDFIIKAVKALGMDLINLDFDGILNKLSIDNIEAIYKSELNKYTIAKFVDDAMTVDMVDVEFKDGSVVNTSVGHYYKEEELKALVKGLKNINLNFNEEIAPKNFLKEDVIESLYESILIRGIMVKKLYPVLENQNVTNLTKEYAMKTDDVVSTKKVFTKEEIIALVNAINALELDPDDLSFDFDNILTTLANKIDVVYESVIMKDIITLKLDEIINSNDDLLLDPTSKANYSSSAYSVYTKEEITALAGFISVIGGNISEFNSGVSLTDGTIQALSNSVILVASISKKLSDIDKIYIPVDVVNHKVDEIPVLDKDEFNNLLTGIKELGVNVSSLNIDNVSLPNEDLAKSLAKSMVLRATIGSLVKSETELAVSDNAVDRTSLYNSDDILLVLKETEFINIFKALNVLNSNSDEKFKLNVSFDALTKIKIDDIYTLCESNVVGLLLSKVVLDYSIAVSGLAFNYYMTVAYASVEIEGHDTYMLNQNSWGSYQLHNPIEIDTYNFLDPAIDKFKSKLLTADDINAFIILISNIFNG